MIIKTVYKFSLCSLALFLLTTNIVLAQNKVVVVPMAADQISSSVDKVSLGGGLVVSNGAHYYPWGAPMTTARTGTGSYSISIPGLRPGCANSVPSTFFSPYADTGFVYYSSVYTNCASGDVIMTINTFDTNNVASDLGFYYYLLVHDGFPSTLSTNNAALSNSPNSGNPTHCVFDAKSRIETCE